MKYETESPWYVLPCPPHVPRVVSILREFAEDGSSSDTYEYECIFCGERWTETPWSYDAIRLDGHST